MFCDIWTPTSTQYPAPTTTMLPPCDADILRHWYTQAQLAGKLSNIWIYNAVVRARPLLQVSSGLMCATGGNPKVNILNINKNNGHEGSLMHLGGILREKSKDSHGWCISTYRRKGTWTVYLNIVYSLNRKGTKSRDQWSNQETGQKG